MHKAWSSGQDKFIDALEVFAYNNHDLFLIECTMTIRKYFAKPIHADNYNKTKNILINPIEDDKVVAAFSKLNDIEQKKLLKQCMGMLYEVRDDQGNHRFNSIQDWNAAHRLLKDRNLRIIKKCDFKEYADEITPDNFSDSLKISASTMSNSSKLGLPDTPYYIWPIKHRNGSNQHIKHFYELCTILWSILCQLIYEKT